MGTRAALWGGFLLFILAVLAVDLGIIRRKAQAVTPVQAAVWTGIWVGLSLLFCGGIWHFHSHARALEFLSGYLIEYALSVDNLFVFLMVFAHFRVEPHLRHRILTWGILGAFAMRATLILAGAALVASFHVLLYLFGAFLLFTAVKMLRVEEELSDPENGWPLRLARRVLPVCRGDGGERFFIREGGVRRVTPLFLVLVVVEVTDLLFALDSIPAVLGVSADPFIIYTSNICAILGLRSLFFVVASLMDRFHYLKFGLSGVLGFVGVKMLLSRVVDVPVPLSLLVIALVLGTSIALSVLRPPPDDESAPEPP